jgi:glutamate dehydrogenase
MVYDNLTEPSAESQLSGIEHFSSKFSKLLHSLESNLAGHIHTADLNILHYAKILLSKASLSFFNRYTLEELELLVQNCFDNFKKYISLDQTVIEESLSINQIILKENTTILICTLSDRPFIVSTISECARTIGIDIRTFLHPILPSTKGRISLSLIEITTQDNESRDRLIQLITSCLKKVICVTKYFSDIKFLIDSLLQNVSRRDEFSEIAALLSWLQEENFIFTGAAEWEYLPNPSLKHKTPFTPVKSFGLFNIEAEKLINDCLLDLELLKNKQELLEFSKLAVDNQIHRTQKTQHFVFRLPTTCEGSKGNKEIYISIIGILSNHAQLSEYTKVPVLRKKLDDIFSAEKIIPDSYDATYLINTVNRMPKELGFELSTQSLRQLLTTGINSYDSEFVKCFITPHTPFRGISIVIIVPRDNFDAELREKIHDFLESKLLTKISNFEYFVDFTFEPQVKLYFYVPLNTSLDALTLTAAEVEHEVKKLSRSWEDNLSEHIEIASFVQNKEYVFQVFEDAFPPKYKAIHSATECLQDIRQLMQISEEHQLKVTAAIATDSELSQAEIGIASFDSSVIEGSLLQTDQEQPETYGVISIYRLGRVEISTSKLLPILENAGVEVMRSSTFLIERKKLSPVCIHRLLIKPKRIQTNRETFHFPSSWCLGIEQILAGKAENDALNSLLLTAALPLQAVSLLRAYSCLLWQVNKFATRGAIFETLASLPHLAITLWQLFEVKFNPLLSHSSLQERATSFNHLVEQFNDALRKVKEITKDRILRSLLQLTKYTLRTNFYQKRSFPSFPLAFKLHSEKIDIMPLPKPMYEIFVRSQQFEGTHLRSSKIARGGIRWSERNEDYRTEILGLMKTQKVKNVLIVASGAKGGFAIRYLPKNQTEVLQKVENCYKDFIRSLLSICDNRQGGEIVQPVHTVIWDDPDPYFVVAADKGTATFSDKANTVAIEEFDFWLGDAFASGGSNGYDHKYYGITAKGAWECVKRHFHDLGLNYVNNPFTAVGIGDMSGDVFGNGMLLSPQTKLIAAFNHKHIFIDPNPNPGVAFEERKRLFVTPRTQWSDYNPALISSGGGVFERFEKEIPLSREIRQVLDLPSEVPDSVNGEELISHILKAPCDLLWNGGIGTYVKSSEESNTDVNDGTNDRVRINATELRAKVVGEGGNLGFTQKARIEYALNGGRINTDAIDNSAGVDLSDHEVNLKILFNELIKNGEINLDKRNELLLQIAQDVVERVLEHNRSHASMLSLATNRSIYTLPYFQSLLRWLTKSGYINRQLDYLPDDDDLLERQKDKLGLSRPELAVCIAGVKMWIRDTLLGSELIKDPLLKQYLLDYFPNILIENYRDSIIAHPLSYEIIASQVTNTVIDAIGVTFIHRMCLNYSVAPIVVLKCILAAELILNTKEIRHALSPLDSFSSNDFYLKVRSKVGDSLREICAWLIVHYGLTHRLDEMVELYRSSYNETITHLEQHFSGFKASTFINKFNEYTYLGIAPQASRSLASFSFIVELFNVLRLAQEKGIPIPVAAYLQNQVNEQFGLDSILNKDKHPDATNKWDNLLLVGVYDDLGDALSKICSTILSKEDVLQDILSKDIAVLNAERTSGIIAGIVKSSPHFEQLVNTINEIRASSPSISSLAVLARQLKHFQIN